MCCNDNYQNTLKRRSGFLASQIDGPGPFVPYVLFLPKLLKSQCLFGLSTEFILMDGGGKRLKGSLKENTGIVTNSNTHYNSLFEYLGQSYPSHVCGLPDN